MTTKIEAPYTAVIDGVRGQPTNDFAEAQAQADAASKANPKIRATVIGTLKINGVEKTTFPAPCVVAVFAPKKTDDGRDISELLVGPLAVAPVEESPVDVKADANEKA